MRQERERELGSSRRKLEDDIKMILHGNR